MLKEIFTWWNGQTFGTRIWSFFNGVMVGTDNYENQYFKNKDDSKRWVIYSGQVESTKVSPEWNNWLRFTSSNIPSDLKKFNWQKDHIPNFTGTHKAYSPEVSQKNAKTASKINDYKKWSPNNS